MDFVSVILYALAIVAGLLLLVLLVVIHELGHAIVAQRNGVEVEEFGIGFPPKAWGKRLKNGVLFTINYLPLGGFVKLKGEHDSDDQKGGYGAASLWVKTKIMLAGVVMNWLTAVAIFTVLAVIGMPKLIPNQFFVSQDASRNETAVVTFTNISPNSPALKAGLQPGDVVKSIDGQNIELITQVSTLAADNAGQTIPVIVAREGQEITKQVSLNETPGETGIIGVTSEQTVSPYSKSTWSAPIVGFGTTVQFTALTFQGIGGLLSNIGTGIASKFSGDAEVRDEGNAALSEAGGGVAGPIGILGQLFPNAVQAGIIPLLFFTGIISLTLAVMNVLPIPALDGGRLYVTLLFRALKKPLTKEREEAIQASGFLALMGLVVVITILDVGRLF